MKAQRTTWRRQLLRVGLCLLLGAVTTVGVAWGAVLRAPYPGNDHQRWILAEEGRQWFLTVWQRALLQQTVNMRVSGKAGVYGPRQAAVRIFPQDPQSGVSSAAGWTELARELDIAWAAPPEIPSGEYGPTMWSYAAGWPALAVHGSWSSPPRYPPRQAGPWGRGLWNTGDGRTLLPYLPIWPGFLLNTLSYAAPWWLLLASLRWGAGTVTRWRRRRRGACLACGYDLRGLAKEATCPECGT